MASLFGFSAIPGARGVLRLALGEQGFRRASSATQSALIVSMVTALLMAPTVRAIDVRRWVGGEAAPPWIVRPALWYLGVNEAAAGHLVNETPVVLPPRFSFLTYARLQDAEARSAYRALQPRFNALAQRAWLSLPLVAALALVTFLWTNRRLPDSSAGPPAASRIRTTVRQIGERRARVDPETQAGFFFALQTLTRSAPHRTIVAVSVPRTVGTGMALAALALFLKAADRSRHRERRAVAFDNRPVQATQRLGLFEHIGDA